MTSLPMWQYNAKKFIINQHIAQLQKALKHWPDSPETARRQEQLDNYIKELNALED